MTCCVMNVNVYMTDKGRAELEPVQISRSDPWCTKMAFLFGFAKKQTEITCFLAKPDECLQL